MGLVAFRSRAAGELFMFDETARRIFEILGKPATSRGVLTPAELPAAIDRLQAAVAAERERLQAAEAERRNAERAGDPGDPAAEAAAARAITLGQRAFPLIEMLRAADRRRVEVTWGV